MFVIVFLASMITAYWSIGWAIALWAFGIVVAAIQIGRHDKAIERSVVAHPSQLRRRQIDRLIQRQQLR